MMMTVIRHNIMMSPLKSFIGSHNSLIPLFCSKVIMIKNSIFERMTKSKFSIVHRSHPYKIINGSIRFAYPCMSDAREAACNAREGSPHHAVGIPVVANIHLHIHLEFLVLNLHSIYDYSNVIISISVIYQVLMNH